MTNPRIRAVPVLLLLLVTTLVPWPAFAAEPNDPGYAQQWGLQRIRAAGAWPGGRGSGIVVAVVDTGVDAAHPDLRGRVLPGKDFVDDDEDAADAKGHGTHVSGTIAAITGNAAGVASVAPGAKILPVRVLGPSGEGDPGDVAEGVRWAVQRGAKVINLSLAQDDELPLTGDSLLRDARVDNAIKDAAHAGAVVVVAAGNDDGGGKNRTAYDATVSGVIVVGATTRTDRRAAYSNYGDGLDLVAPGGGSATDAKACNDNDWIVSTWWNPAAKRSDYGGGCGTSMAVAHVSGVAALLLAKGYSNAGAVQRMVNTAVDVGARGRDEQTGAGRVDALAAAGGVPASKASVRPIPSPTVQGGISNAPAPSSPAPTPATGRPEPQESPFAAGVAVRGPTSRPRTGPIAVAALFFLAVIAAHGRRAHSMFSG